jgi:hypothetical protein
MQSCRSSKARKTTLACSSPTSTHPTLIEVTSASALLCALTPPLHTTNSCRPRTHPFLPRLQQQPSRCICCPANNRQLAHQVVHTSPSLHPHARCFSHQDHCANNGLTTQLTHNSTRHHHTPQDQDMCLPCMVPISTSLNTPHPSRPPQLAAVAHTSSIVWHHCAPETTTCDTHHPPPNSHTRSCC